MWIEIARRIGIWVDKLSGYNVARCGSCQKLSGDWDTFFTEKGGRCRWCWSAENR